MQLGIVSATMSYLFALNENTISRFQFLFGQNDKAIRVQKIECYRGEWLGILIIPNTTV